MEINDNINIRRIKKHYSSNIMTPIKCVALIVGLGFVGLSKVQAECGYESCHLTKDDEINIHLVPHSHDDLGWLKTYEQYYYGARNDIYSAGVQYILSSVVEALKENPDRRFIYVETGFFWKWWTNQNENTRTDVRNLVESGQLEFISGGWSMNDEATTYYQTIIDQMTWGLRRLNDTFGECGRPKVGWQIDPFGHSREMASIFAQIGFDGFFLNRIDYQDHSIRQNNKGLEFVWRGSPNYLGESSDIYTNVLFRHYSAPSGLCFDTHCNDEPIIDDPDSPEYNVNSKAEHFVNDWIKPALNGYVSNNILVPMGDDFQYENAIKNFINMDKLISYMNDREFDGVKYNVIYSTPSCYLKAVHEATNATLKTALKTDDFFPYASSSKNYWTGYYSSRPTAKKYGVFSNNFLQVCKQLASLSDTATEEDASKLNNLRESLGVFQHHDAIAGTEKEAVAHDYIRLLHLGISKCEEVSSKALEKLVKVEETTFTTCHWLNISQCDVTEQAEELVITLYNPLGRAVDKYVRIPVVDNSSDYVVIDPSGDILVTQIIPIHESVLNTPGRDSEAKFDLVFKAEIPALGYKSFYYQKKSLEGLITDDDNRNRNYPELNLTYSPEGATILMKTSQGLETSVGVSFMYYTGSVGNYSAAEFTPSSNYIFRPDPDIPIQQISTESERSETFTGPLVTEVHFYLTDWFSYIIRTYSDSNIVEVNYLAGPLPYGDQGIEVVARYTTDLDYNDTIYTDTNGRETIERIRDYRASWDAEITEPEAGNYYPIVTGILVQNGSHSIAVLNDRAQGGGSMEYQSIEFMIHRNTIKECCGVGEPLKDQAFGTGTVTRGSHYIQITDSEYEGLSPKEVSQQIYLDSWTFFSSPNGKSFDEYQEAYVMQFSGLNENVLPRNIHLLTLELWGPSTVLLRLENFEGDDDQSDQGTSSVNLQELFTAFTVEGVRETTLAGNQWLEDNVRLMFNTDQTENTRNSADNGFLVTLSPMQIRTFIVTISY